MEAGSSDGDGSSILSRRQASADYLYSDGVSASCRGPSPWRMRSIRENVRETPETPSWNPAGRLHVCAILGTISAIAPLAQGTVVSGPTVAQRWWGSSLHTQTALNFSRCVSRLMPPQPFHFREADSNWAHVYFLKLASRLPALVPHDSFTRSKPRRLVSFRHKVTCPLPRRAICVCAIVHTATDHHCPARK